MELYIYKLPTRAHVATIYGENPAECLRLRKRMGYDTHDYGYTTDLENLNAYDGPKAITTAQFAHYDHKPKRTKTS